MVPQKRISNKNIIFAHWDHPFTTSLKFSKRMYCSYHKVRSVSFPENFVLDDVASYATQKKQQQKTKQNKI